MFEILLKHLKECMEMGKKLYEASGSFDIGWMAVNGAREVAHMAFNEHKITHKELLTLMDESDKFRCC